MDFRKLRRMILPVLLLILLLVALNTFLVIAITSPTIPTYVSGVQRSEIATIDGNYQQGIYQNGLLGVVTNQEQSQNFVVYNQQYQMVADIDLESPITPVVLTSDYVIGHQFGLQPVFSSENGTYQENLKLIAFNGTTRNIPISIPVPVDNETTLDSVEFQTEGALAEYHVYELPYILAIQNNNSDYWIAGLITLDMRYFEIEIRRLGYSTQPIEDIIVTPGYTNTIIENTTDGEIIFRHVGYNSDGESRNEGRERLSCNQCTFPGMAGEKPFIIDWESHRTAISLDLRTLGAHRSLTIESSKDDIEDTGLSIIQQFNDRYLAIHLEYATSQTYLPESQFYIIDILENKSLIEVSANPAEYDNFELFIISGSDNQFYSITQRLGGQNEFTVYSQKLDVAALMEGVKRDRLMIPLLFNVGIFGILATLVVSELRREEDSEQDDVLYPNERNL